MIYGGQNHSCQDKNRSVTLVSRNLVRLVASKVSFVVWSVVC